MNNVDQRSRCGAEQANGLLCRLIIIRRGESGVDRGTVRSDALLGNRVNQLVRFLSDGEIDLNDLHLVKVTCGWVAVALAVRCRCVRGCYRVETG